MARWARETRIPSPTSVADRPAPPEPGGRKGAPPRDSFRNAVDPPGGRELEIERCELLVGIARDCAHEQTALPLFSLGDLASPELPIVLALGDGVAVREGVGEL